VAICLNGAYVFINKGDDRTFTSNNEGFFFCSFFFQEKNYFLINVYCVVSFLPQFFQPTSFALVERIVVETKLHNIH